MLPELLVALACVEKKGCGETASRYYETHVELQEQIKHGEEQVKRVLPSFMTQYGAPFIYILTGGEASVRLYKQWSYKGSLNKSTLNWTYNF